MLMTKINPSSHQYFSWGTDGQPFLPCSGGNSFCCSSIWISLLIRGSKWESSWCKGLVVSPRISVVDAAVSSAFTISHSWCLSLTVGCTVSFLSSGISSISGKWRSKKCETGQKSMFEIFEVFWHCPMKLKCPWIIKPKALLISKWSWWVLSCLRSGDSLIQCYKREFVCPAHLTFAECPAPCDVI